MAIRPYVFVDFIFDEGLFFISIRNYSNMRPAFKVSVHFDQACHGLEGTKRLSDIPLFNNIEFLAPQKQITTFLDTSASYFRRGEPTVINTTITYKDRFNTNYSTTTTHDLGIYRGVGYVKRTRSDGCKMNECRRSK